MAGRGEENFLLFRLALRAVANLAIRAHVRVVARRIWPRRILTMSSGSYKVTWPTQERLESGPVDHVYFRSLDGRRVRTDWEIRPRPTARIPATAGGSLASRGFLLPDGQEKRPSLAPVLSRARARPRQLSPKETAPAIERQKEVRSPRSHVGRAGLAPW